MVVVQIYILAFPIEEKKIVSQDCHPFIWYIPRIPLERDFSFNVTHRRAILNLGFRDDHVSS